MKYIFYFCLSIIFSIFIKNSYGQYDFYSEVKKSSSFYFNEVRSLNEINSPSVQDSYPWLSTNGMRVYYTKGGTNDVFYFASRADSNSNFTNNAPLPMKFTNINMYSIWLTDDELEAYYILYKPGKAPALYYSNRASITDDFSDSTRVALNGRRIGYVLSPSLSKDKSQLYLYNIQTNNLETTYIFSKVNTTSYTLVDSLKPPKNFYARPGQLSKDNSKYYIGLQDALIPNGNGKTEIYYYIKDVPSGKFKVAPNKIDIQAPAVTYYDYYQPSLSKNDKYLVFVSNQSGSSTGNNLYLAANPTAEGIGDNAADVGYVSNAFPNPAIESFSISYNLRFDKLSEQKAVLEFYNMQGAVVKEVALDGSQSGILSFSVSDFAKGLYFYNVKSSKGSSAAKKIVIL